MESGAGVFRAMPQPACYCIGVAGGPRALAILPPERPRDFAWGGVQRRSSPQPLKGKPTTSGFLTRWRATTPSGTDDYASEAAAMAIVNIHPITAKKTEKMIPISDSLYFMMLDRQAVTVSS